ncbi:hypothetical protein ACLOBS_06705 [Limosilactobacillus mucosae]|uniref:hypothetical protein n=1 Tax=Limosilactobacillus mucosae TaxID=97478 RepID=UPI003EBB9431
MPVSTITAGQKDWLTTLNNNSNLINKLPVDGKVYLNNAGTFVNGASASNIACTYAQFNGFKVVNLYFINLTVPAGAFGKKILSLADNIKPTNPVAFVANQESFINTSNSNALNDLYFWTTASGDQKFINTSFTYVRSDN